jgi:hypothetical protein
MNRKQTIQKARKLFEIGLPYGGYKPCHLGNEGGARNLKLGQPNIGNPLNELTVSNFRREIKKVLKNEMTPVLGITSISKDLFSHGIDVYNEANLKAVNSFKLDLFNHFNGANQKNLFTVFDGEVTNAGYTNFAVKTSAAESVHGVNPKFLIGTDKTRFSLKGLADGRYPIGGGFQTAINDFGDNSKAVSPNERTSFMIIFLILFSFSRHNRFIVFWGFPSEFFLVWR